MHLVGFIVGICHDARLAEDQMRYGSTGFDLGSENQLICLRIFVVFLSQFHLQQTLRIGGGEPPIPLFTQDQVCPF